MYREFYYVAFSISICRYMEIVILFRSRNYLIVRKVLLSIWLDHLWLIICLGHTYLISSHLSSGKCNPQCFREYTSSPCWIFPLTNCNSLQFKLAKPLFIIESVPVTRHQVSHYILSMFRPWTLAVVLEICWNQLKTWSLDEKTSFADLSFSYERGENSVYQ